jgi:hypothetical protein
MYERVEKKLHLYAFEPADHTTIGEICAMRIDCLTVPLISKRSKRNSALLQTANSKTFAHG